MGRNYQSMNNLVSIITPSYNSTKFIKECIDSVLAQTYQEWEMLIVDDCSKDDSVEYIQSLIANEPRIKLMPLDKNVGAAMARNRAIEEAQGRYIAFLDSDDIWLPNKLEVQLSFMKEHNYPFTFSAYNSISEDGSEEFKTINVPQSLTYNQYLADTIIGCLTVIIDKEQTGDFRMPNIRSSHDMALWLDILKRGFKAYGLNENLAKYRLVSNSNTAKKYKAIKEVWDVYRNIEHFGIIKSAYYWIQYLYHAIKKRL